VPAECRENVRTTAKTMQEWKSLFASYSELQTGEVGEGNPESYERVLLKTLKKFRELDTDLRSIIVPGALEELVHQVDMPSEHWWDDDDDASLLPAGLSRFLNLLREFLTKYDTWLLQPHNIMARRAGRLEEDIHQLRFYCEGVNSKLGWSVCIQGVGFPDVWAAIEFVASSMPEDAVQSSHSTVLNDLLDKITGISGDFVALRLQLLRVEEKSRFCEESVGKFDARFAFIHPILLSIKDLSNLMPRVLAWLEALEERSRSLREQSTSDPWTNQFRQDSNRAPTPDSYHLGDRSEELLPRDSDACLRTLEHTVKSLEKRIVGDGICIKNFLFQSKEDMQIWLKTNLPNNRFGLFLDAVSIFNFLAQSHTDDQANMSHLYASQKSGFDTTYESTVLSFMKNLFPNIIEKGGADGLDTSKLLPGLSDADKWISNGVTGLQMPVEWESPNVDDEFQSVISSTFEDFPEARDLVLELLYRSKKFALDLCHFIQRDFDFWKHKGYSKKEFWELTCLSVQQILEDIQVVRIIGHNSRDLKNPDNTATAVIWATLKAHTVMAAKSNKSKL
jgi:hypothetical protein